MCLAGEKLIFLLHPSLSKFSWVFLSNPEEDDLVPSVVGFSSSLIYSGSPTFWAAGVQLDVLSFTHCILTLFLYLSLQWMYLEKSRQNQKLVACLTMFVGGLAISHS